MFNISMISILSELITVNSIIIHNIMTARGCPPRRLRCRRPGPRRRCRGRPNDNHYDNNDDNNDTDTHNMDNHNDHNSNNNNMNDNNQHNNGEGLVPGLRAEAVRQRDLACGQMGSTLTGPPRKEWTLSAWGER